MRLLIIIRTSTYNLSIINLIPYFGVTASTGSTTTVGPPTCSSHSYSKGPTCSQYYECVAKWWWYEPVLRTCNDGYYFSESQSACVLAAESGCT